MIYNNNFQFAELTQKSSKVKKSACPRQKYAETSKMQKSLPFPKCFRISSGR